LDVIYMETLQNRPPLALMIPPKQGGAKPHWGRCGRTPAGLPRHRLPQVGS